MNLSYTPTALPRYALFWEEVQSITMQRPTHPLNMTADDLRHNIWETCDQPRIVPVMGAGRTFTTLILPQGISYEDAQDRVQEWSRGYRWDTLMALDHMTWLVFRQRMPDHVIEALVAQEHGGDDDDHWYDNEPNNLRGGMFRVPDANEIRFVMKQPEDFNPFVNRALFILAHAPHVHMHLDCGVQVSVLDMRIYLANSYKENVNAMLLSTTRAPLQDRDLIKNVPGRLVVLRMVRYWLREEYVDLFDIPWSGEDGNRPILEDIYHYPILQIRGPTTDQQAQHCRMKRRMQ